LVKAALRMYIVGIQDVNRYHNKIKYIL